MLNPFRNKIVTDPWNPVYTDVKEINETAFNICTDAFESVKTEKRSMSALLYGETGSGKTHLLSRLRTHLQELPGPHIFVSVRLQASPHRFWRHFRKCFVESLLRPAESGTSQLENVFLKRLYAYCRMKQVSVKMFRRIMEQFCAKTGVSWNLCKVLEHLIRKRHRLQAIAWLKGELLPEGILKDMEISQEDDEILDPEDRAQEMIKEFCRLAGPNVPVVVCFDQVEALQRYPKDVEGLYVFGQAIRSLHDETENVLLVSCIQFFFLDHLKSAVMQPDYDALAGYLGSLNPLSLDESLKLISARLDAFPDLSDIRKELFGHIEKSLKDSDGKNVSTAREVLSRCSEVFDNWKKTASTAPPKSNEEFLKEENIRRKEKGVHTLSPENSDEIIQSGLPVIVNILDPSWKEFDQNKPPDVDIVLDNKTVKVGVSLCNQENMAVLAGRLRRLRADMKNSELANLVLFRHSDLPIQSDAVVCKQYIDDLKKQKVKFLYLTTEILAELESFVTLLTDARSGNLIHRGKALDEEIVRKWIVNHIGGSVTDLVREVLTIPSVSEDEDIVGDLEALLEKERVIKLEDAAHKLKADAKTLEDGVLLNKNRIGYLEGPPPVVFQNVTDSGE